MPERIEGEADRWRYQRSELHPDADYSWGKVYLFGPANIPGFIDEADDDSVVFQFPIGPRPLMNVTGH